MEMCTNCGNALTVNGKFCGHCGTAVSAAAGHTTVVLDNPTDVAGGAATQDGAQAVIDKQVAEQQDEITRAARRMNTAVETQAVVYVVDVSGSTSEEATNGQTKLEAEGRAVKLSMRALLESAPGSHVAVIAFNNRANIKLGMTPVQEALPQLGDILQDLEPGGGTSFNSALKLAPEVFQQEKSGMKKKMIFLSDGLNGDIFSLAHKPLHEMGVEVETIGFAKSPSEVGERALREMASTRDGQKLYHFAGDPGVLNDAMETSIH